MANNNYKWEFENIGGSSRVKIRNGEDIARLAELDPKMWTVLSCPVTGLEIDDKSLAYMDCDSDGKIRVNDVIATAQWITAALKNSDLLLEGNVLSQIHPTVSGLLSRLEKKDFLELRPDPSDRRCKRIFLLPKGYACLNTMHQTILSNENRLVADFTEEEKSLFFDLLSRAITNMGGSPCHPHSKPKEEPNQ